MTASSAAGSARIVSSRWSIPGPPHRLETIAHQVYQYLLNLDRIDRDLGKRLSHLDPQMDLFFFYLDRHEIDCFVDECAQILWLPVRRRLADKTAQALDDLTGAPTLLRHLRDGGNERLGTGLAPSATGSGRLRCNSRWRSTVERAHGRFLRTVRRRG